MGFPKVSKKIKAASTRGSLIIPNASLDQYAPKFIPHPKVVNKRFGLDTSVFLHKALGNIVSAGEFQVFPNIPISAVEEVCVQLVNLARKANITLVSCADGRYHPFKQSVNSERRATRSQAQDQLNVLFRNQNVMQEDIIGESGKRVSALMKKAVYVREDILHHAMQVFKKNKVEVYCAPYEADFQLAYWEKTGFTDGTITIDSDLFFLGSGLVIDELDYKSSRTMGSCIFVERNEVMNTNAFTKESSKWSDDDLLVYGALNGCDWLPRLYGLRHEKIEEFMEKWVVAETVEEKDDLLEQIAKGKYWPKEGAATGKGNSAESDFPMRFKQCLNFMKYAPVIKRSNDEYRIGPLQEIPDNETRLWHELIGFNPLSDFQGIDVKKCYSLDIFPRTKEPLMPLPLPEDPLDPTRKLPHNSIINIEKSPIGILPHNVLLDWMVYHGVPMPKGTSRLALIERVRLAYANEQPLDRERISLNEAVKTKSYISWESMGGVSGIRWNNDKSILLQFIRSDVPTVNSEYVDKIFGTGMNGIRERSWLRFVSGSLDIQSLTLGTATIDGQDEPIRILRIKCTPSMKSEVYDVSLSFKPDGSVVVYLPEKSKCDCPNGWLFCSHSLAFFILIRLLQVKRDWSFADLCKFMPPPIKSLQNLPLAAANVLKSEKSASKAIGKAIAKEVRGYSAESNDAAPEDSDVSAADEMAALQSDLQEGRDVKSIDLCQRLDDHLRQSKETKAIDGEINSGNNVPDDDGAKSSRVTADDIHKFNRDLVHKTLPPKRQYVKLVRHNCLQQMMDDNLINDDNALSHHLRFFSDDRNKALQQKHQTTRLKLTGDDVCGNYDKEFLAKYFDSDDDSDDGDDGAP